MVRDRVRRRMVKDRVRVKVRVSKVARVMVRDMG